MRGVCSLPTYEILRLRGPVWSVRLQRAKYFPKRSSTPRPQTTSFAGFPFPWGCGENKKDLSAGTRHLKAGRRSAEGNNVPFHGVVPHLYVLVQHRSAVTWRYWPMESLDKDAERGLS
jgi:hypothetical protein